MEKKTAKFYKSKRVAKMGRGLMTDIITDLIIILLGCLGTLPQIIIAYAKSNNIVAAFTFCGTGHLVILGLIVAMTFRLAYNVYSYIDFRKKMKEANLA